MEQQRKLYLFDGQTYIFVPESAWLSEIKSNPTGMTALRAIEDPLILKGWVKTLGVYNPELNSAYTSEWFFEETGTRLRVLVDEKGQLTIDGTPIGSTTMGETFRQVEKIAEDRTGKWVTAVQEVKDASGQKVLASRKVFIPPEKVRSDFVAGAGAKKPQEITRPKEKGGPHPVADILSGTQKMDAMAQLIGTYSTEKAEPSKAEAVRLLRESGKLSHKDPKRSKELARQAFKIFQELRKADAGDIREEIIRACNLMLDMAEKEENEDERRRLCEEVEKQLRTLEAVER